jgi:hypothetical protein
MTSWHIDGPMATYRVRAIGADFEAGDEGCEYLRAEDAKCAAVKAGIAIATDEIIGGKDSSIVEVHVLDREQAIGRFIVALSVAALR